jgi:hypothetical protein
MICAVMEACLFSAPYQLTNLDWRLTNKSYRYPYERATGTVLVKFSFSNINWGGYCLYGKICNTGYDTLVVTVSEYKAFDRYGDTKDQTFNGRRIDAGSSERLLIPGGKSVSILLQALSLRPGTDRKWVDSVYVVFAGIRTTAGKSVLPLDTLVFAKQ